MQEGTATTAIYFNVDITIMNFFYDRKNDVLEE
jgi:hypothetical protein